MTLKSKRERRFDIRVMVEKMMLMRKQIPIDESLKNREKKKKKKNSLDEESLESGF